MKWHWLVLFLYIKKFKFHYAWIVSFKNKLLCVEHILGTSEGSDLHIKYVHRAKSWHCSRWALGTSLSCIRPFHVIVENVRHSCLLQTTLHVLSVVAEFGSLIEIKIRRTFLNVRNSVKAVHKPVAGFWMWEKSVGFRARHPWVARDSVLIVTGANEVVKQHVGGTPLSPGDAQVALVVVGTVVGVLEDLAHGGADDGRVGTRLPELYKDTIYGIIQVSYHAVLYKYKKNRPYTGWMVNNSSLLKLLHWSRLTWDSKMLIDLLHHQYKSISL